LDGDFDIFNIRWDDVRNKLKKDEIAVEFAHITRTDTKEKAYLALILTSKSDAPECVMISTDNTLEKLYRDNDINTLYNSSHAGDVIWSKIIDVAHKKCPDIKTIYFVPDGVLHSMSIEYMISHGNRMSEQYNMRRLSSSRDIVKATNQKTSNKSAVLFGGIDYNTAVEDMEYYSYTLSQERSADGFWNYLPGTQEEIDQIVKILGSNSYTTELHSGASCIEEQFKIYSKNSPEIIHIATHGFYKHDESSDNENEAISEGISLKKCGLAFAGANQSVLGNHNIPDDVDDGILSASEISKLDLGNTSLVVMSACQTGLGDINDDGVFGLQRAFKKAGVNSILMSMWNVDDHVTQSFMTEFYQGLATGLTKHQALAHAQQYVIKTYGNNPR
jgi:CHAT domain-containing protein